MVPNAQIRELRGVKKGLDERIDGVLPRWFGHVERLERNRIAKRVYVGECAGSRSVARPRKRWIDVVVVISFTTTTMMCCRSLK